MIEFDEFREFLGFEDWIPPPSDTMDASGEPLPPGWVSRESQSRPGKLSYENTHTGEAISWIPKQPASKEEGESPDLFQSEVGGGGGGQEDAPEEEEGGGARASSSGPRLPIGWLAVKSVSRPGETSYMNEFTGARIAWRHW